MKNLNLLVEEAYYWNYAQHLDFSYLDHPPMVALLIKLFTLIFGTHEFSVRLGNLFCWGLTAFFSYKLSELINKGSGFYVVLLVTVLPFFFFQFIFITPDVPLLACWSASLYCLYRALVLNDSMYWYGAGFWLGCGMLSKYTICLLGLATLFYIITNSKARHWLIKKEPYFCALITIVLFTPVIYWNSTHEWVSFIFQSSRRFASIASINVHEVIGLTLLFLTPIGVYGLWALIKRNTPRVGVTNDAQRFIQVFTLIPLGFFTFFSLNHQVNFNWIGPLFLALMPWLAALIANIQLQRKLWLRTGLILVVCYSGMLFVVIFNKYELIQQKVFVKVISWSDLVSKFYQIAQKIEANTNDTPIFVPLDHYPISSELAFYQAKFFAEGSVSKIYPIIGAHIFGRESLMYRYWSKNEDITGKTLILISKELWRFDGLSLNGTLTDRSPVQNVWSTGQGQNVKNIPYYYKVVRVNAAKF